MSRFLTLSALIVFTLNLLIIPKVYAEERTVKVGSLAAAIVGPLLNLNDYQDGSGLTSERELEKNHALLIDSPTESLLMRIELLRSAQKEILFSTFIFEDDTDGAVILRLLEEAARRGVRVRLLLDSLGKRTAPAQLGILYSAGDVGVYEYNPLNLIKPLRALERMHDKLIIVDGKYLMTGGRNVENPYFGTRWKDHRKKVPDYKTPYTDRDVLVTGPAAKRARSYFINMWKKSDVKSSSLGIFAPENENQKDDLSYDLCISSDDIKKCLDQKYRPGSIRVYEWCKKNPGTTLDHCNKLSREYLFGLKSAAKNIIKNMDYISVYLEDRESLLLHWQENALAVDDIYFMHKDTDNLDLNQAYAKDLNIGQTLLQLIRDAKDKIFLATPYLVPTPEFLDAVDFTLSKPNPVKEFRILTNSLWTTDHALTYASYENHRSELAKRNLTLSEYDFNQNYHSKAAVFDQTFSFIGSYNIDPRSQNLNTETGVLIVGQEFNELLSKSLQENYENSFQIGPDGRSTEDGRKHPNATLSRKISYMISKGLLFFFPFLNNQL